MGFEKHYFKRHTLVADDEISLIRSVKSSKEKTTSAEEKMSSANCQSALPAVVEDSEEEDDNLFDDVAAMAADGQVPGFNSPSDDDDGDSHGRVCGPNKKRDFEAAFRRFRRFYFSRFPVYDERDFDRHFQIPRRIFERINTTLREKLVFVHRLVATGKHGVHPKIRIITTISLLAYGISFDSTDELCKIAANTCPESFLAFITKIKAEFGAEYLR